MALKLARIATGRHKTISMWESFHGASLDCISVGGEAIFRANVGPLLPGTGMCFHHSLHAQLSDTITIIITAEHAPPCDEFRCMWKCGERGGCDMSCADYVVQFYQHGVEGGRC